MQLRKKYEQIVDRSASKEALKNVVKGRLLNFDDSFFFLFQIQKHTKVQIR